MIRLPTKAMIQNGLLNFIMYKITSITTDYEYAILKARGGVEGSKNLIFDSLFVANTCLGGSCGTKISNQRDCRDPKNEV